MLRLNVLLNVSRLRVQPYRSSSVLRFSVHLNVSRFCGCPQELVADIYSPLIFLTH